jgi:hypothetical protein
MKLKIVKGPNYDAIPPPKACTSCSGSGYYDSWDYKRNRSIKCSSCDNTGLDEYTDATPRIETGSPRPPRDLYDY